MMTTDILQWLAGVAAALAGAPLLFGVINRAKALFAGRRGPSVFQLYRDIYKLARKRPVYSSMTGMIFKLAPVVVLAFALRQLPLSRLLLPGICFLEPLFPAFLWACLAADFPVRRDIRGY